MHLRIEAHREVPNRIALVNCYCYGLIDKPGQHPNSFSLNFSKHALFIDKKGL